MKGTLHKEENGWVVKYLTFCRTVKVQGIPVDTEYFREELPLHPDCDITPNPFNNYGEGKEIDFDIVLSPTEGTFNHPKHYAKLTKSKEEVETLDSVKEKYYSLSPTNQRNLECFITWPKINNYTVTKTT